MFSDDSQRLSVEGRRWRERGHLNFVSTGSHSSFSPARRHSRLCFPLHVFLSWNMDFCVSRRSGFRSAREPLPLADERRCRNGCCRVSIGSPSVSFFFRFASFTLDVKIVGRNGQTAQVSSHSCRRLFDWHSFDDSRQCFADDRIGAQLLKKKRSAIHTHAKNTSSLPHAIKRRRCLNERVERKMTM